jgi:D-alanine-D-alanine ligase
MSKKKVGVIFGGISTEHDVSVVSGTDIMRNIDKEKYEVIPIYIDEQGTWHEYKLTDQIFKVGDKITDKKPIENICEYLKKVDVIFPVLHGLGGEDGTIQGMLELLKIPYVGSKVLGSSICMDKVYAKIIFEKAGLLQTKYLYIRKYKEEYIYVKQDFEEDKCTTDEIVEIADKQLKYPMFIKPSNSGSSVGISKATNKEELKRAIEYAAQFDKKILIEEGINAREIECAVLGNEELTASILGEVLAADTFYSFDAKYMNQESRTEMPAKLSEKLTKQVQELAKKAYKAADCKGLSRVDFFVDDKTEKIYINEINTIPGFTQISMYPKLLEKTGIPYKEILTKLIELAE